MLTTLELDANMNSMLVRQVSARMELNVLTMDQATLASVQKDSLEGTVKILYLTASPPLAHLLPLASTLATDSTVNAHST